ncbi:hypothetical protein [Streptomyces litchfieldiae]|uniref:Uncharacterized protein n=1 Tax=Streptomyces litchfieldiae TaxID=3075543 RepID=A0ABU2MRF0_9ACTN|nr:hypothetical protein [Streptomyces sp. DSM 44938]MDT0344210.1 hypothetical protein [Streptomyces sp. DSM 44938]
MSAELALLATTAAQSVITLMCTDAWTGTRNRVVGLWHRFRPEQEEDVAQGLDGAQGVLTAARAGSVPGVDETLTAQWATRFAELLAQHPEAAAELRALTAEAAAAPAPRTTITASGPGAVAAGTIYGNVTTHTTTGPEPPRG